MHCGVCKAWGWEDLGANQGKIYDHEVAVAHTSSLSNILMSTQAGKSLTAGVCPEKMAGKLGEGQGGRQERRFRGNLVSAAQGSLGPRGPKGSSGSRSLWPRAHLPYCQQIGVRF